MPFWLLCCESEAQAKQSIFSCCLFLCRGSQLCENWMLSGAEIDRPYVFSVCPCAWRLHFKYRSQFGVWWYYLPRLNQYNQIRRSIKQGLSTGLHDCIWLRWVIKNNQLHKKIEAILCNRMVYWARLDSMVNWTAFDCYDVDCNVIRLWCPPFRCCEFLLHPTALPLHLYSDDVKILTPCILVQLRDASRSQTNFFHWKYFHISVVLSEKQLN